MQHSRGTNIGPGNKFYNNTIIGRSPKSSLITPGFPSARLVEVYNNIFAPSSPAPIGGTSDYSIHDNIFFNTTSTVPANNLVNMDPKLTNLAGTDAEAAKLSADSPAIDRAVSAAPSTDYFRVSRPRGSAADIGAHEYDANAGSSPRPPTNLVTR